MKICHISTVHPRYDIRIFHKECKSLAKKYKVYLIVADGLGDEFIDNVQIIDIGLRQKSRLKRIFVDSKKAYKKALGLKCNIYHLHDPELIPVGLKLRKKKATVIFDAHEDFPKQILSKPYLNKYLLHFLSSVLSWSEKKFMPNFSAIITATSTIREKFSKINTLSIDINNYPILNELNTDTHQNKKNEICYIGGISEARGIKQNIETLNILGNVRLNLAGNFIPENLREEITKLNGWQYVNEFGFVDREQIKTILSDSLIGLVTLLPTPNLLEALPIKMFEYMSASIPFVASNFPLWEKIVNENQCGICVDPKKPAEIAQAIDFLIKNPGKAEEMGKNGRSAVENIFNWQREEEKLFTIYAQMEQNS